MTENTVDYAWLRIQTADGAQYAFAIDPDSYIKRDIVDFAPRSGGGDVAYSNLDLYQIVTQDSWHHGLGFINFRDKFGYRVTNDGVDTRHVGMAMLFTKYTDDYDSAGGGLINCVDFGGSTYFNMGSGGVWKRTTGGTWSKVLTATVGKLMTNGAYMIASLPSGRMKTSSNGTTWTDAGVSGNPPNYFTNLDIHNGFMWGSEAATSAKTMTGTNATSETLTSGTNVPLLGTGTLFMTEIGPGDLVQIGSTVVVRVLTVYSNTIYDATVLVGGAVTNTDNLYKRTNGTNYDCVHFWSSADSSDAEGAGINDIGAITVGAGSPGIKAIASFNGALHIARPDGVWAVDDTVSPPLARRVLSFVDEQHSSNFAVFVPWRGRLYLNIKNALYAYNGSSLANVTPPTYSLDYPPAAFGGFIAATYRGPYLYVLASDNQATPNYYLLAFDGTGWFLLLDLGVTAPTGIGYSPLTDHLFIGLTGGKTLRVPFQAKSELPYASFDPCSLTTVSNESETVTGSDGDFTVRLQSNVSAGTIHLEYTTYAEPHTAVDTGLGHLVNDEAVDVGTVDHATGSCLFNTYELRTEYGATVDYQYYSGVTVVNNSTPSVSGSSPSYSFNTHASIVPGTLHIDYFAGTPVPSPYSADDGGDGFLYDALENQVGTIVYATGAATLIAVDLELGSGFLVDYHYHNGATDSVSGAPVTLTGTPPSVTFSVHADVVVGSLNVHYTSLPLHTATDSAGVLRDEHSVVVGSVNYYSGELRFNVSALASVVADYDHYSCTRQHYLNLSEIDFGFRRVKKSFAEIDVEVYNVAVGRNVAVEYSADGGAWYVLGSAGGNGVTQLNMSPTVEANKLDVRLGFQTNSATQSPILRNVTIKAMIRPDTLYGHQMVIIGANEARSLDNRFINGSSEEQRQWLEAVRDSKAPVTFTDHFGVTHQGYISTTQFFNIQRRPGERQSNWSCRINLVEVR